MGRGGPRRPRHRGMPVSGQSVDELLRELVTDLAQPMAWVDTAEEEIAQAQSRHPLAADRIWHAFPLLVPTHRLMSTDWVYRSHCRALLDRIASAADTREATAAEVAVLCSELSLLVAFNAAATALYMRTWTQAFPDQPVFDDAVRTHYDYVAGDNTDRLEADVRRSLRKPQRTLAGITCAGRHHGQGRPNCPYVTPPPLKSSTAAANTTKARHRRS